MRRPNLLCSSIVLAMSCAPAHAMTLTEAIQSTVENHPQIQASQNARLSADEEVKVAKGGYLPSVDVLAGYGRQNSDTPSTRALSPGTHNKETLTYGTSELRLRQMLFDGFNTPNEVARTEAVVNSRAYYTLGTAEALALRTIEVYLDVLKRREMVTLATNNLQAHLRMHDQIRLRSDQGVGRTADSDQAEARLALAQNNLYTEQVNLADAEAMMAFMTDRVDQDALLDTHRGWDPGALLLAREMAATFKAPVLMFHGDLDLNVGVGHSREMDKKLRAAGKPCARLRPIHSSAYPTPARRPLNSRLDGSRLAAAFELQLPDWRIGVRRMLTECLGTP